LKNRKRTRMMKPSDPTIATPKKLIFTIKDTSSLDGLVVT
jgi:hypothetical protein